MALSMVFYGQSGLITIEYEQKGDQGIGGVLVFAISSIVIVRSLDMKGYIFHTYKKV